MVDHFKIVGRNVYDPDGKEFICKGANILPFNASDEGADKFEHLFFDVWKFNSARLNHFPQNAWYSLDDALDFLVPIFTKRKAVLLLDLAHEADRVANPLHGIGTYWEGYEAELVNLYSTYAARYKDNPYIWFNPINEPAATPVFDINKYNILHAQILIAIRQQSKAPIWVEAAHWGQDGDGQEKVLSDLSRHTNISNADTLVNLLPESFRYNIGFCMSIYDQWKPYPNTKRGKFNWYIDEIDKNDTALMIVEYGVSNGGTDTLDSTQTLFDALNFNGKSVGRMVWHWKSNDFNDLCEDEPYVVGGPPRGGGDIVSPEYNPTNLTELGKVVWFDNHHKIFKD